MRGEPEDVLLLALFKLGKALRTIEELQSEACAFAFDLGMSGDGEQPTCLYWGNDVVCRYQSAREVKP